jgi:outer membrane protein assembly factor BamB
MISTRHTIAITFAMIAAMLNSALAQTTSNIGRQEAKDTGKVAPAEPDKTDAEKSKPEADDEAKTDENKSSGKPDNWPQFRGIQASGVSSGDAPVDWQIESGKNIQWKARIDGLAHSCPITFGKQVFITTAVNEHSRNLEVPKGFVGGSGESAIDTGKWRWQVASFDLATGVEIWRRTVATGKPTIKRHIKSTHANATPATDGKHVIAFFGSEGLYCLNMDGDLLWKKDLGRLHSGPYDAPKLEWAFGSSPIIHDGKVILQCDCLNTGFIAILDVTNGKEILRIKRDDVATWATPTIVSSGKETQLICNGYRQMAAYDLCSGEMLWNLKGGGDVPVPAPLFAHGMIYLTSGHGRSSTYAISPSARGDITPKSTTDLPKGLTWWEPRGGSYVPTPIIVDDLLYTCSGRGVLTVRSAMTGELVYQERLGGQYSASAVATKSHLYLSSENGVVTVVKTGREFQLISENDLQEAIFATPAIAGDTLLVRTTQHLIAIQKSVPSAD